MPWVACPMLLFLFEPESTVLLLTTLVLFNSIDLSNPQTWLQLCKWAPWILGQKCVHHNPSCAVHSKWLSSSLSKMVDLLCSLVLSPWGSIPLLLWHSQSRHILYFFKILSSADKATAHLWIQCVWSGHTTLKTWWCDLLCHNIGRHQLRLCSVVSLPALTDPSWGFCQTLHPLLCCCFCWNAHLEGNHF